MAHTLEQPKEKLVVRLIKAWARSCDLNSRELLEIFENPDIYCPLSTDGKSAEEYVDYFRSKPSLVEYGCLTFVTWLENLFLRNSEPVVTVNDGSTSLAVRKTDFATLKDWFEELKSLLERYL